MNTLVVTVAFLAGTTLGALTVTLLIARVTRHPSRQTRQEQAHAVVCTSCERPFQSVPKAREHAMDVHNAPDRASADHLLASATVDGGDA